MNKEDLHILQVGNVLVSPDVFKEKFCCDLSVCNGQCCVEGDAGAPVTLDEIGEIENVLDDVWTDLNANAQSVIDKQGVAYTDCEGDLVTSIVNGKDCVFTCYEGNMCLCALERAYRNKKTSWCKPISCSLYPIRVKDFGNNLFGINYNKWKVCKSAVEKGEKENIPVYKFLKGPLINRFGEEWYKELCGIADELKSGGYI